MDAPVDQLMQRLLRAASDEAQRAFPGLLAEARAEAEQEVKAILKSAMKAALLERAVASLAQLDPVTATPATPPPPPSRAPETTGCYVYGITRSGHPLPDVPGVADDAPLRLLTHRSVQAVVSDVDLTQFSPSALHERIKDLDWIAAKARAHDQVLKGLLPTGPVIPFRFCTILRGDADLADVLTRRHDPIIETLDALTGKSEWGVKIVFTPDAASASTDLPTSGNPSPEPSGKAYLLQKKREKSVSINLSRTARARAADCHQRLAPLAADSVTLPIRATHAADPDRQLIRNAAYLIPDAGLPAFRALLDTLRSEFAPNGLSIELTGPWPPYNFIHLDLTPEEATR